MEDKLLAEGEALLKRINDHLKLRDSLRKKFVKIEVLSRIHPDGTRSVKTVTVPRSALPKG